MKKANNEPKVLYFVILKSPVIQYKKTTSFKLFMNVIVPYKAFLLTPLKSKLVKYLKDSH